MQLYFRSRSTRIPPYATITAEPTATLEEVYHSLKFLTRCDDIEIVSQQGRPAATITAAELARLPDLAVVDVGHEVTFTTAAGKVTLTVHPRAELCDIYSLLITEGLFYPKIWLKPGQELDQYDLGQYPAAELTQQEYQLTYETESIILRPNNQPETLGFELARYAGQQEALRKQLEMMGYHNPIILDRPDGHTGAVKAMISEGYQKLPVPAEALMTYLDAQIAEREGEIEVQETEIRLMKRQLRRQQDVVADLKRKRGVAKRQI